MSSTPKESVPRPKSCSISCTSGRKASIPRSTWHPNNRCLLDVAGCVFDGLSGLSLNLPGLVNIQKTMENHNLFMGKNHYFYGDFPWLCYSKLPEGIGLYWIYYDFAMFMKRNCGTWGIQSIKAQKKGDLINKHGGQW